MNSLLIKPKDHKELLLMKDMLKKMSIPSLEINTDESEDLAFAEIVKSADRSKKASREQVMNKLSSKDAS